MNLESVLDDPPVVTAAEVCRLANLTRRQLGDAIKNKTVPAPQIWLSPRVMRWSASTIAAWLSGQWKPAGKEGTHATA